MDVAKWLEHRWVRGALIALGAVVATHLVAGLALVGMRQAHAGEVLPGAEINRQPVGGLSAQQLAETMRIEADRRLGQPLRLVADGEQLTTDRAAAGASVDVQASVEAVWERGRRGLYRALYDQFAARLGTLTVPMELTIDEDAFTRWAQAAADELSTEPQEADLGFEVVDPPDQVDVEGVEPVVGVEVDAAGVADRAENRIEELGAVVVRVPAVSIEPTTTAADLDAARGDAELAVSGGVTLENPSPGEDLALTPADLAEVLVVERDPDEPEGGRLHVTTTADRLLDHLGEQRLDAMEVDPVAADLELGGDNAVEISGGTEGFDLDAGSAVDRILRLAAQEPPRVAELPGDTTLPA